MSSLKTNFFVLNVQTVVFLSIFFFDFSAVPAVTCVLDFEVLQSIGHNCTHVSAFHVLC